MFVGVHFPYSRIDDVSCNGSIGKTGAKPQISSDCSDLDIQQAVHGGSGDEIGGSGTGSLLLHLLQAQDSYATSL